MLRDAYHGQKNIIAFDMMTGTPQVVGKLSNLNGHATLSVKKSGHKEIVCITGFELYLQSQISG